ncbi:MAG TPA: sulfite exporter TauE/SafE family protein [Miltoncostaeaceae bacterium]|nr:sulfite exporter TauE/SafE family protein [Miltoncostaeaceae bacterium]
MSEASNGTRREGADMGALVLIGLVAGLFSALFGVGGGIVMVPLLMALMHFDAKVAAATSLATIIFTAIWGTLAHGAFGNGNWAVAALVGLPALVGVSMGIAIKARISSATLTYAFAALMVAAAIRLVIG